MPSDTREGQRSTRSLTRDELPSRRTKNQRRRFQLDLFPKVMPKTTDELAKIVGDLIGQLKESMVSGNVGGAGRLAMWDGQGDLIDSGIYNRDGEIVLEGDIGIEGDFNVIDGKICMEDTNLPQHWCWQIDPVTGELQLIDETGGLQPPILIAAGADKQGLKIGPDGSVGVHGVPGDPNTDFHIYDATGRATNMMDGQLGAWEFFRQRGAPSGRQAVRLYFQDGDFEIQSLDDNITNPTVIPFKILEVWRAPTNSLVITGTGNIGAGTDAPISNFHIRHATSNSQLFVDGQVSGSIWLRDRGGPTGKRTYQMSSDLGKLRFRLWNDALSVATERMEIDSLGNVRMAGVVSAFQLHDLTTTQKNALTPERAFFVFDNTLGEPSYYDGTSWLRSGVNDYPAADPKTDDTYVTYDQGDVADKRETTRPQLHTLLAGEVLVAGAGDGVELSKGTTIARDALTGVVRGRLWYNTDFQSYQGYFALTDTPDTGTWATIREFPATFAGERLPVTATPTGTINVYTPVIGVLTASLNGQTQFTLGGVGTNEWTYTGETRGTLSQIEARGVAEKSGSGVPETYEFTWHLNGVPVGTSGLLAGRQAEPFSWMATAFVTLVVGDVLQLQVRCTTVGPDSVNVANLSEFGGGA